MRDIISSFGERFSAQPVTALLCAQHLKAETLMPHQIGLITDGKYGDATANIDAVNIHLNSWAASGSAAGIYGSIILIAIF